MCSVAGKKSLGRIITSTSRCIFNNLAYEEHLLRTHDPETNGDVMLLWSNRPAVVVGRHQNPWAEINVREAEARGVAIVRRHSGGGTVYHDEGNLNISILTTQKAHCRKKNLQFIADAINARFTLKVVPTARDDLEMQPGSRKTSGTAARIARGRAYHHMTMLVRVDLDGLRDILHSDVQERVVSTATRSVRAPAVGYLGQDDATISVPALRDTIAAAYRSQFEETIEHDEDVDRCASEVDGVRTAVDELTSWEWIWGRTPPFKIRSTSGEISVKSGKIIASPREDTVGRPLSLDLID